MKATTIRKWCALGVFLFLSMCGTLYFLLRSTTEDRTIGSGPLTNKNAYFVPMKMEGFSPGNIPYFTVNIENQTVVAKVDLGYEGYIALSSDVIEALSAKKFIRRSSSYGLKGKVREFDVYELERIHTKTMSFYPVLVDEESPEFKRDINLGEEGKVSEGDFGRVGWRLFQNFNLLVDHENSTFALCDSLETLKKRGYPVDCFSETPLLLDRGLIEFEAQAEAGLLRCVLDSGSTWNLLNRDPGDLSNSHIIFTQDNIDQHSILNPENKNLLVFDSQDAHDVSVFNLGGKEFGPITFTRIKSPMAIDAILGMEFLKDTLIFIDFANRKIYFFEYPEKEGTPVLEQPPARAAS
ncbi:MAG: hypothetical protein HYZ48_04400 [Chlamydiales bacterium]|nr:hypothetical protein [Chlamydiales bacterium]